MREKLWENSGNGSQIGGNRNEEGCIESEKYMKYNVVLDDTLIKIALRFQTTIGALVTINHLSSQSVYPGQVIYVPWKQTIQSNEESGAPVEELCPKVLNPNKLLATKRNSIDYSLTILNGSIRTDATIVSAFNEEKRYSELTLNPTSISVSFHRPQENVDDGNGLKMPIVVMLKKYTISLKSIDDISFHMTLDELMPPTKSSPTNSSTSLCEETMKNVPATNVILKTIFKEPIAITSLKDFTSQELEFAQSFSKYLAPTLGLLPSHYKSNTDLSRLSPDISESNSDNTANRVGSPKKSGVRETIKNYILKRLGQRSKSESQIPPHINPYIPKPKKYSPNFNSQQSTDSPHIKIHSSTADFNVFLSILIKPQQNQHLSKNDHQQSDTNLNDSPRLIFKIRSSHRQVIEDYFTTYFKTQPTTCPQSSDTFLHPTTDLHLKDLYPSNMLDASQIMGLDLFLKSLLPNTCLIPASNSSLQYT